MPHGRSFHKFYTMSERSHTLVSRPSILLQMVLLLSLLVVGAVARVATRTGLPEGESAAADLAPALAAVLGPDAAVEGFARAEQPRPFVFPNDHGAHPDFRAEWWYFTGNLKTAADRHFGYQFTLFRFGLPRRAGSAPAINRWHDGNLYMGHLAVTDTTGGHFHAFERFGRAPTAGARSAEAIAAGTPTTFEAWLDDWQLTLADGEWRLQARVGEIGVALSARPTRPRVLQGRDGLSVKGSAPGNASYYYSETRLETRGQVHTADGRFDVTGLSWLDREWSTSALETGQVGWDWFALQLDDGRDLMFYRLRREQGTVDPHSAGVLVWPDGRTRALAAADVTVTPTRFWTAPDGARYPVAWTLALPAEDLTLGIRARIDDQLHTGLIPYWEGAVTVRAAAGDGRRVSGQGYVELTGYGPAAQNGMR